MENMKQEFGSDLVVTDEKLIKHFKFNMKDAAILARCSAMKD
jgi:hypothetical protein